MNRQETNRRLPNQKRRLEQKGENTILPIVGHVLSELRLRADRAPQLIFSDDHDSPSELELWSSVVTIWHGESPQTLEGLGPKATWNPGSFGPLLMLLGRRVSEAIAEKRGTLRLDFSPPYRLTAVPDVYEGWRLCWGSSSLIGDTDRLIAFTSD